MGASPVRFQAPTTVVQRRVVARKGRFSDPMRFLLISDGSLWRSEEHARLLLAPRSFSYSASEQYSEDAPNCVRHGAACAR